MPPLVIAPKLKVVVLTYSKDPDEAAHNEPPHLDLYCLHPSLSILSMIKGWEMGHYATPCFSTKLKIVVLTNSKDQNEAAQKELPHLDLYCFPP